MSMEINLTVLGVKTAFIFKDLIYSEILSSLKGWVFKPYTINIALIAAIELDILVWDIPL